MSLLFIFLFYHTIIPEMKFSQEFRMFSQEFRMFSHKTPILSTNVVYYQKDFEAQKITHLTKSKKAETAAYSPLL